MTRGRSLLKRFIGDDLHNRILSIDFDDLKDLILSYDFDSTEIFKTFKNSIDFFSYNIEPDIYVSYLVWVYRIIFENYPNKEIWESTLNNWSIDEIESFIIESITPIV